MGGSACTMFTDVPLPRCWTLSHALPPPAALQSHACAQSPQPPPDRAPEAALRGPRGGGVCGSLPSQGPWAGGTRLPGLHRSLFACPHPTAGRGPGSWGAGYTEARKLLTHVVGGPGRGRRLALDVCGWVSQWAGQPLAGALGGSCGQRPSGGRPPCLHRAAPGWLAEPPCSGPGERECRAGWKKALEAERPCLCWRRAEAPPAFDSPPPPPPRCPSDEPRSPGSQGRWAEHFVPGARVRSAGQPNTRPGQAGGQVGRGRPVAPSSQFHLPLAALWDPSSRAPGARAWAAQECWPTSPLAAQQRP